MRFKPMVEFSKLAQKFFYVFVLTLVSFPCPIAIAVGASDGRVIVSCAGEQYLHARIDELQNRQHRIDEELQWLLKERDECERNLRFLRHDLDVFRNGVG